MPNKSFKIITLGCKLNFAESSTMARNLMALGFEQVSQRQIADICLVNTCAVTQQSEKKCRQIIHKVAHENENALIALTGCHATLQSELLQQMPEIGIVAEKPEVVKQIADYFEISCVAGKNSDGFFSAYSLGDRTRSFLKVQDGCDYKCAYCTVPLARGASRNIAIADLVLQANAIAASDAKEIILTGVNIGDFGKTTGETFLQLIKQLNEIQGIERYRISSIEPNLLTEEIINFVAASSKFLPHFHIPLQAGSNRVLNLMKRRYTTELFAQKIRTIQEKIPAAFIGVDVIAGFPTETDEEFAEGVELLKSLQVSYLHVFPYSQRPNTEAINLQQTPQHKITKRAKILSDLCTELHHDFYEKHINTNALVLFEGTNKNGTMTGFSENYIKAEMPYDAHYINQIAKVKFTAIAETNCMKCEFIN